LLVLTSPYTAPVNGHYSVLVKFFLKLGVSLVSVLATFSKANLNSPSKQGLLADKMDVFFESAKVSGVRFHHVLLPGESTWLLKTPYEFTRLPNSFKFWMFSMFSFVFRKFGLNQLRLLSLRAKSRALSEGWDSLIQLTNSRAIVGIGIPQELIRLAKLKGLPCIEFQHGLFDRKGVEKYWPKYFPTHMFCWDEFSAQEIRSFGIEALVVGHPIAFYAESLSYIESVKLSLGKSEDLFCIALSYGERGGLGPSKSITDEVIAAINEALGEGFEPIFRLHPVVARRRFKRLLLQTWLKRIWKDARIDDPLRVSLADSASRSEFLLTSKSSSAFEFALLGKPSVVLDQSRARNIQESIIQSGIENEFIFPSIGSVRTFTGNKSVRVNRPLNQVDEFLKIVN